MKSLIRLVENVENETDGLIVSSGVGSRIMSSCSHVIGGAVGLLLPEMSGITAALGLPAARTLPYLSHVTLHILLLILCARKTSSLQLSNDSLAY